MMVLLLTVPASASAIGAGTVKKADAKIEAEAEEKAAANEQAIYASLGISESDDLNDTVKAEELNQLCKDMFKTGVSLVAGEDVTWQEAVCETARAAGIIPDFTPESEKNPKKIKKPIVEYPDEAAFEFVYNIGREYKIWTNTKFQDAGQTMTKQELVNFMSDLTGYINKNKSKTAGYGLNYIHVSCLGDKNSQAQLGTVWAGLIQVPFEVLREYRDQEYKISIKTNYNEVNPTRFHEEEKTIYVYKIFDAKDMVRTMGYFVNYICGIDEDGLVSAFNTEKDKAMQLTCDQAGQNENEFFVELFAHYITNQYDKKAMDTFTSQLPNMAELFANKIANGWDVAKK